MADVALCRPSPERLEVVRDDPSVMRALRAEIRRRRVEVARHS